MSPTACDGIEIKALSLYPKGKVINICTPWNQRAQLPEIGGTGMGNQERKA
jgi:hypothetical protein